MNGLGSYDVVTISNSEGIRFEGRVIGYEMTYNPLDRFPTMTLTMQILSEGSPQQRLEKAPAIKRRRRIIDEV